MKSGQIVAKSSKLVKAMVCGLPDSLMAAEPGVEEKHRDTEQDPIGQQKLAFVES